MLIVRGILLLLLLLVVKLRRLEGEDPTQIRVFDRVAPETTRWVVALRSMARFGFN